jgi:hypothetical protein
MTAAAMNEALVMRPSPTASVLPELYGDYRSIGDLRHPAAGRDVINSLRFPAKAGIPLSAARDAEE